MLYKSTAFDKTRGKSQHLPQQWHKVTTVCSFRVSAREGDALSSLWTQNVYRWLTRISKMVITNIDPYIMAVENLTF